MNHDQRFKTLIRMFFAEFLQLFFSDWLDLIDLSEVEWLEQEVTPEPPGGLKYVLDLVAKVRSREPLPPWHLGADAPFLLAVLIEIESPDNTVSIRERVPEYARNLKHKLQMPVLPIVLFLKVGLEGVGKLIYEERIRDLVTEYSESLYVGLPHFDAVQYVNGDNWLGVALSALMRIPPDQVVLLGAEALRRLAGSSLDDRKKFLLGECVQAYLPLTEDQARQLEGILETKTYSEVKAVNLTVYDKGMIKGIEKGREEGREQGQISGLISGLMFATELKFGRTDPVIAEKLNALSSLDEIGRAQTLLKQTSTPEEFLRELGGP